MPRGDNITQEAAQRRQLQQQLRTQRAQERHTRESRLRDDRSNYLANRRNAITATGGLAAHSRGVRKAEFPSQYREGAGGRMVRQEAAPAFRDATAASAQGLTTNQYVQQRDVMQTNEAVRYGITRSADAPFQAQRQETARSRIAERGANYRQGRVSDVNREAIASGERVSTQGQASGERIQAGVNAVNLAMAEGTQNIQEITAHLQYDLGMTEIEARQAIAAAQNTSNENIATTSAGAMTGVAQIGADASLGVARIGADALRYQVANQPLAPADREPIVRNDDGTAFDPNTGTTMGAREMELKEQSRLEQIEREFAQQDRDSRIVDIIQGDPAMARNIRDDHPDWSDTEIAEEMVKGREFIGGQWNPANRSFLPGRMAQRYHPAQSRIPYRGRLEPDTSYQDR